VNAQFRRRLLCLLLLLGFLAGAPEVFAAAAPRPVWLTSFKAGKAAGEEAQKPVLVYFHASWCRYCRRLEQMTFSNPRVQRILAAVVLVKLDLDDREVADGPAQKFNIRSVPSLVILSSQGKVLASTSGYLGPDDFEQFIGSVTGAAASAVPPAFARARKQALTLLGEKELTPAQWRSILQTLANLRSDRELGAAIKERSDLAVSEFVQALKGPSLAIRLAAFQILQDVSGHDFSFDPWAAPGSQAGALAKWQEWEKTVKASGLPAKRFLPLTRNRIRLLLGDLLGADEERTGRARIQLSRSRKPGLNVIRKTAANLPGLDAAARLKIKEVIFSIQVPGSLAHRRLSLAHTLVYGDIEMKTRAIETLQVEGKADALALMAELLRDHNPLIRETAIQATRLIGTPAARKLLLSMKDEKDLNVRVTLIANLGVSANKEAVRFVLSNLAGSEEAVLASLKALAGRDVAKMSGLLVTETRQALKPLFKDKRWRVRGQVLGTVSKLRLGGLDDEIIRCLDDKDDFVRKLAIQVCGRRKLARAESKLIKLFKADHAAKPSVVAALLAMDRNALVPKLVPNLMKAPPNVILAVLDVLADRENLPKELVISLLNSSDNELRAATIRAVGRIAGGYRMAKMDPGVLDRTTEFISKEHPKELRVEALKALRRVNWLEYEAGRGQLSGAWDEDAGSGRSKGWLGGLIKGRSSGASDERRRRRKLRDRVAKKVAPCLTDPDFDVRYQAAALFGHMGALDGVEIIHAKLGKTLTTDEEREEIAAALTQILSVSPKLKFPPAGNVQVREKQLTKLVIDDVSELFKSTDKRVLMTLSYSAGAMRHPKLAALFLNRIREKRIDFEVAFGVIQRGGDRSYYGGRRPKLSPLRNRALEFARAELENKDEDLSHFALILLGRLGGKDDATLIRPFLKHRNKYVRRSALIALCRTDQPAGRMQAEKMLKDPFWGVNEIALTALSAVAGDYLYLADKIQPGDRFYHSMRFTSPPSDESGDDLFADEQPVRRSGRPGKAVLVAALQLMSHENKQVRFEAGKLLLKARVKTDYTQLIDLVLADKGRDFEPRHVAALLRQYWPRVPVEFYPLLKKYHSAGYRSEAAILVRRMDREKLQLVARSDKEEFEEFVLTAERAEASEAVSQAGAARPVERRHTLAYFYQPGCRDCQRVAGHIRSLQKDFPNLELRKYNVLSTDSAMLNEVLCERTGIPAAQRQFVPAVFSSSRGLVGKNITLENLVALALASENRPAPWEVGTGPDQAQLAAAEERIRERHAKQGLVGLFFAGLLDGINPCAFTVIIFFLSYLTHVGRAKRDLLLTGLMFTSGVFITYFLVGLGLLEAVQSLKVMPALSAIVYWLTAGFALTVAVLSFRDGILCLRGRLTGISLQLPTRIKNLIHRIIRKQTRVHTVVVGSFVTGFLVSLLELACTGQVYWPVLVIISRSRMQQIALLLLYNLAFILPLLAVFLFAWLGLSSEKLTALFRRHVAVIKFLLAALFFGLFAFLVALA